MTDEETMRWANATPEYRVTHMRLPDGSVAPHYRAEIDAHGFDFEALMGEERFARIIDSELAAEAIADGPLAHLAGLAPDDTVREAFLRWLGLMNADLEPWTTGGAIHFRPHWSRVLMLALSMAHARGMNAVDLDCVAAAAVFHDSRRKDPYLDTGHGERAAHYYLQFCRDTAAGTLRRTPTGRTIAFDARTYLAVRWHDRDDELGLAAIDAAIADNALPEAGIEDLRASLPAGAQAGFADVFALFKDADALDRVRLGSMDDSGLDVSYLRTPESHALLPFAWKLLEASAR